MKMLQESTGKMRELERLGLALDKKGTVFVCLYYAPINAKPPLPGQGGALSIIRCKKGLPPPGLLYLTNPWQNPGA